MLLPKTKYILLFLVALFLAPALFADTILLKDGSTIEGTILSQTRTEVRILVDDKERTIQKLDIRKITFSRTQTAEEKRKEEAEQKRKREAEQKRKREAEQKRQQEAEQKRQQEAEQKRQQEAEQKRQQEAEQKRQSEAEQKRQQEAEQKRQLEAEQKHQSEAEQKRQLEEQQKQKLEEQQQTPHSTYDLLSRSAIFPGLGNIHAGSTWSGFTYMGLFSRGLYQLSYDRQKALQAEDTYEDITLIFSLLSLVNSDLTVLTYIADTYVRQRYVQKIQTFNQTLQGVGVLYGLQLLHAYLLAASPADEPNTAETRLHFQFRLYPEQIPNAHPTNAVKLGFTYSF